MMGAVTADAIAPKQRRVTGWTLLSAAYCVNVPLFRNRLRGCSAWRSFPFDDAPLLGSPVDAILAAEQAAAQRAIGNDAKLFGLGERKISTSAWRLAKLYIS